MSQPTIANDGMVWHVDAIVQSLLWCIFGVWHGGTIAEAEIEYWGEFGGWVCRERDHGGGRDHAGFGAASGLARNAHSDGRVLGARMRIGGIGGGEESYQDGFLLQTLVNARNGT